MTRILVVASLGFNFFIERTDYFPLIWAIIATHALWIVSIIVSYRRNKKQIKSNNEVEKQKELANEADLIAMQKQKEEEERQLRLNRKVERLSKIISETDPKNLEEKVVFALSKELDAVQSAYYRTSMLENKRMLKLAAAYAYHVPDSQEIVFEFGEGLCGQVAKDGRLVNLNDVPEGYITILSGLGKSTPGHLVISPVKSGDNVVGVIELASFCEFGKDEEELIHRICNELAVKLVQ